MKRPSAKELREDLDWLVAAARDVLQASVIA
jgi:hypothetical protein